HRGPHVDRVDVRPLLPVDLHRHEAGVDGVGHRVVLERLVRHHMAPVARRIADREEDGAVRGPCLRERGLAPLPPVDRVVRVLPQVGGGAVGEPVRHASTMPPAREGRRRAEVERAPRARLWWNQHMSNDVQDLAVRAGRSDALEILARVGYAASGLMHLLIAWIAVQVALGESGEADEAGALQQLSGTPVGGVLLWVMAGALVALAVWHLVEAVLPHHGSTRDQLFDRGKAL